MGITTQLDVSRRKNVLMGRAFVPLREAVTKIAGTRVSPMTVTVSKPKLRIYDDLLNAVSGREINEDTDTSAVLECKIGHVRRDFIWRILYLYGGRCQRHRRNGYGTQRYHQVRGPCILLLFAAAVSNTYQ